MVNTKLYGYLTISGGQKSSDHEVSRPVEVFTDGELNSHRSTSVLGRMSYIDDILIPASSWTSLYQKMNRFLEVCDLWNLLISLPKSVRERRRVKYLEHQVSISGIEADPKDLGSLVNITLPNIAVNSVLLRKPELLQPVH